MTTGEEKENGWLEIDLGDSPTKADDVVTEEKSDETPEKPAEEAKKAEAGESETDGERKSRAKDRIRGLVQEKKEIQSKYEAQLQRERQEKEELKRLLTERERINLDANLKKTETTIEAIQDQLIAASTEGDKQREVELQRKLISEQLQYETLNARKAMAPRQATKEEAYDRSERVEEAPQYPDEMKSWLRKNDWFFKDRRRQAYAIATANTLKSEGYEEDDPEFYEKLDEEIQAVFGETEEGVVKSNQESSTGSKTDAMSGTSLKRADEKKPASPVAGASRAPVSRPGSVVLSPDERKFAERMGIDPKAYALRKKQIGENTDKGWIEIA